MKDLFGKAILDYQTKNNPQPLRTETSISEADELDVAYLFRSYDDMPEIEKQALQLSFGKVLDVGCGAGSHSLYLQNRKNLEVVSLDISASAIEACKLRGLRNPVCEDISKFSGDTFDTILLMMNGAGICGKIENVPALLTKLADLLNPGGQILLDSSDIIYMFDDDADGGKWIPGGHYYGELTFYVSYKGESEVPFDWLYIDFDSLQEISESVQMKCDLICEGEHFDYLARISL